SNGEEEGKGNLAVQQAGEMMHHMAMNYVGNIEPGDMLRGGIDVVVTDGFIGNILLKTFEASTRYLANVIRDEIRANWLSSLGGLMARGAFRRVRSQIDTSAIGGAPLLGVNGVVIIAHGSSSSVAIKNAIHQAVLAADADIVTAIHEGVASMSALNLTEILE
ncbi:phosphate--acyl-ACP acyltransferase, partial [bacterium]|nr:phosphate--acyl-ACP acyltransferase [bacterium]